MKTTPNTLVHLIKNISQKIPNAPCLLAPDKKPLSFIQLIALIESTHRYLNQQGFGSTSRIALILPNTVEAAAAFLSISSTCTVIPLSSTATDIELKQLIPLTKLQAIITTNSLLQKIEVIGNIFDVPIIELISDDENGAGNFILKGGVLRSDFLSNYVSSQDLAMILLTSGSTSTPKIIPIKQGHYCSYLVAATKIRFITFNDRYLNLAYLHHLHGLNGVCVPVIAGGSCVCPSKEQSLLSIKYLEEFNPTFYTALPTQYQQIASQATAKNFVSNGSLRGIITGSSAISRKLTETLESLFNAPVIDTYGMSETLGICSNPLPPNIRKYESVGIALPNVQITVVDQNDSPVMLNSLGEIVVKSPWILTAYLENNELNKTAFCKYGFRTGDIGYLDTDNYLFITGRVNEMINRGGEKISPAEIDQELLSHPNITEAVTFPVNNNLLGKDIVAAIVTNDKTITPDNVQQFIKNKLSSQKIPSQIIVVKNLPKGSSGKIQRNKMAEHFKSYINNKHTKSITTLTTNQIQQTLTALWAELLPTNTEIKENDSFFDLGGDSFLFIQLTFLIEKSLGISFSETTLLQGHTIKKQTDHLRSISGLSKAQNSPVGLTNSDFKRLLTYSHGKEQNQHPKYPLIFPYNEHLPGIPLYFVYTGNYLAAHIKNRPLYDLTSGFNLIKSNENNFTALADYYVEKILKINPSGPYLLGGYCSGALLAFEIATRLLAQEKSVPLLIMIDQGLPNVYTGNIAFMPFNSTSVIEELSRLENSDILKKYYPFGWTLDIIQSKHYSELFPMTAMIIAERIEARIQQQLEGNEMKPLPDIAKQCDIQVELREKSFDNFIFDLTVTNCSEYLWPAGQVCITYNWLSNLGRVISYSENKVTINCAINPGQKHSFLYKIDKLKESAKVSLVFTMIDNFGSWFDFNYTIEVTTKIDTYDSPTLNLESINKIADRGNLTLAIQNYHRHLHFHKDNSSEVLTKLAKIVRLARGSQNAIDIYHQALKNCTDNKSILNIHQKLVECYLSLGDLDAVIYHSNKALILNNNNYLILSYLGLAHAHKNNFLIAIKIFNKITSEIKQNYTDEIISNITNFIKISSKENYRDMNTFCLILIKHNPYNASNHYIYADNLIYARKYKKAEQIILDGIQVYPFWTFGYEMLYSLYMKQEQFSKAITIKYKICALKPFCIEQHKQLLHLLTNEQRLQDAAELQKKISQLNQSSH